MGPSQSLYSALKCLRPDYDTASLTLSKCRVTFGVDWSKVVIALTFADALSVPKSVRQDPNYDLGSTFLCVLENGRSTFKVPLLQR